MTNSTGPGKYRRTAAVLLSSAVLLIIWWIVSQFVSDIILPPPSGVFSRLAEFLVQDSFHEALKATVLRGIQGFVISLLLGTAIGILAGSFAAVEALFRPLLAVIKATPVLSVILLAFIWFQSGQVPVFASVLMALPVVTQNVMVGVREIDRELVEMAWVYRFTPKQRFFHITLPAITPFFLSGAKSALGLTWKVVVASEVLTVPRHGIGTGMQFAQINLDTAGVLAWTAAAILLSAASDLLFDVLTPLLQPHRRARRGHGD